MLETIWLNPERAAKIFPNIGTTKFNKYKDEFIKLWEAGYYPRESYLSECKGIEIKAFVHYLSWRDYFQDANLIKEVELFKGVWQCN